VKLQKEKRKKKKEKKEEKFCKFFKRHGPDGPDRCAYRCALTGAARSGPWSAFLRCAHAQRPRHSQSLVSRSFPSVGLPAAKGKKHSGSPGEISPRRRPSPSDGGSGGNFSPSNAI